MPLISILIPSYNKPIQIKELLDSILQQSFKDYEIIITDDTENNIVKVAVEEYDDSRIKYLHNIPPLKSGKNWNAGLKLATGEYIKIMHDDDSFVDSESLQCFVSVALDNPHKKFFFCNSRCINRKFEKLRSFTPLKYVKQKDNIFATFPVNYIGAPSVTLIKSEEIELFDENLIWFIDLEFYLRVLVKNTDMYLCIDKELVNILAHDSNKVTTKCLMDPNIELWESIYLYNKIKKMYGLKNALNYIPLIIDAVSKYSKLNIPMTKEIKKPLIYLLLIENKYIRPVIKLFIKFINRYF